MDQIFQDGLFEGDVAIVTGGGTGIGFCTAEEMGRLGAKIAICGRRQEPLDEAAEKLRAQGIEVYAATCDIREAEAVEGFADAVADALGTPSVLINNAGGQFPMPAQMMKPKGFAAVVRNNLLGTWNFCHAVGARHMIPAKRGRIVNVIAQIARGFPGMVHTGAARAGVENVTKTLAVEWAQFGIRTNAVAPGVIKTSGTRQYPPSLLENSIANTPMRRLGTPEETAHLITYLATRYADFITGQTFYIDGGASLWGTNWHIPDEVPQMPPYPIPED